MSQFKKDVARRVGAAFSTEANHDQDIDMGAPIATLNTITADDVQEATDARAETTQAAVATAEIVEDVEDIATTAKVVQTLTETATAAENCRPVDGEVVSSVINSVAGDMAESIGANAPKLTTNDEGRIDTESMEGFMDWTKRTTGAVVDSTSHFFTRIGLAYKRLSNSTKTLAERTAKVRTLNIKRRGSGGKALHLSNLTKSHLVITDGYSKDIPSDLKAFLDVSSGINAILAELHARVLKKLQENLAGKVAGQKSLSVLAGVETSDLLTKLDALLKTQPDLLGNVRFFNTDTFNLTVAEPSRAGQAAPAVLVKHLDPLTSLSVDEVNAYIGRVEQVLRETAANVDSVVKVAAEGAKVVDQAVRNIDKRLNAKRTATSIDDEDSEFEAIDFGSEYEFLYVLGRIESKMLIVSNELNRKIGAAIEYAEESAFQD